MTERELDRLRAVRVATSTGTARSLRLAADLSQAEVAAVVGVSQATIALWEAGKRTPRGEPALRYADVLEGLSRAPVVQIGRVAL